MKGRHFAPKVKKDTKRIRNIILSMVAVLELVLLLTSMTFSWFEGLTSLEMKGSNIKSAPVLKSHAILGENKSASDTTYNEVIDLTGYFDAQKEVRLSPVSSADAKNFYALYEGTAGSNNAKFRQLGPEDINANIIRFEFNLSSPDGPTDIYLSELAPRILIKGETKTGVDVSPYRIAFSDGRATRILCASALDNDKRDYSMLKSISSITSENKPVLATESKIENYQRYIYSTNHEYTEALFHLEQGEVKTITCSVWVDALDPDYATYIHAGETVSFTIRLCSTWSISQQITVYDYTADRWIDDKNSSNKATALYVRNADGNSNNRQYELTYDAEAHTWTGTIPNALQNCEFIHRLKDNVNDSNANRWQATNRGNQTEITMLGKKVCVWGMSDADVELIYFRDYTTDGWIANKDDKGNKIDMSVNIVYDNRILEYYMTSEPTKDHNTKNSWSCYIPSDVDFVKFLRQGKNTSDKYVTFNYWNGDYRGSETVYRATESNASNSSLGTDKTFILYLSVNSSIADKFHNGRYEPTISYTSSDNAKYTSSSYDRTKYNPSQDFWPTSGMALTPVSGKSNLYYMAFEQRPTGTKNITIWNRREINKAIKLPLDVNFGIQNIDWATYNTLNVNAIVNFYDNNHYMTCSIDNSGSGVGNTTGNGKYGRWGDIDLRGTYTTYFVPSSDTTSVTVSYTNENYTTKIEMTKGSDGMFYTNIIPDGKSIVTFTDNNGNTWIANNNELPYPRSAEKPYYYTTDTAGKGLFYSKITTSGNKISFKHYDKNLTSLSATFKHEIKEGGVTYRIPFTVSLTKGNDNLTWTTSAITSSSVDITFKDSSKNTWTTTSGRNTSGESYAIATSASMLEWKDSLNYKRIYFTNATNYTWSNIHLYWWTTSNTSNNNGWPGQKMTKVMNNGNEDIYVALLPNSMTAIIFNNGGNGKQTKDMTTTSVLKDLKGFYVNGGSGTAHTVGSWDVSATNINQNTIK